MRSSIKEILAREEKLGSQNSVLVTLATGTQEEINVSQITLFHDLLASIMRSDIVAKVLFEVYCVQAMIKSDTRPSVLCAHCWRSVVLTLL